MNVAQFIEATRRKLDEIERDLSVPTERDLVRALTEALLTGEPIEEPLRALLARMAAWDAALPVSGDAAGDGGERG